MAPGVDPASNGNEYQEGGRRVRLTTRSLLPHNHLDFHGLLQG
jgi:hypothetical protein